MQSPLPLMLNLNPLPRIERLLRELIPPIHSIRQQNLQSSESQNCIEIIIFSPRINFPPCLHQHNLPTHLDLESTRPIIISEQAIGLQFHNLTSSLMPVLFSSRGDRG